MKFKGLPETLLNRTKLKVLCLESLVRKLFCNAVTGGGAFKDDSTMQCQLFQA